MGAGLGPQVRLHDDDAMQWLRALLMEHVHLVYPGFYGPLSGGLFEVLRRDVVVIDLVAILAMGASPGIGTGGGEVPCRIVPQRGNQVEMALRRSEERRVGKEWSGAVAVDD